LKSKKELQAKEVTLAIMDSQNGKVLCIASSNRFLPKDIKRSDYPSLNISAIEYSFEPGSVIKPLTFALLLDKNLINPYDIVRTYNGKFKIGRKIITDEHKYKWLSAEDVIVHSSNIGIAQLAQKLSGAEFYMGLKSFGLTKKSTPDLIYERRGMIPSAIKLENKIYKATASYGYGIRANLMQLLRAYSAFNNDGKMVTPKIVKSFYDPMYNKNIPLSDEEALRAIKSSTAFKMQKILIKTVNKGTGRKTITPGLVVGGKTGTAYIVEKGQYVDSYNNSFIGFVNDKRHKYTMGVLVIKPKVHHFASQTAVPVFKKAIDILVDEGYLKPSLNNN
jgi:cell division protein FtsI (penicillin-binding protein 3)